MINILMMDLLVLNQPHLLLHYHLILQILLLYFFVVTMMMMLLLVPHIEKEVQPNGNHLLGIHLMKKTVLKHLLYELENLIYHVPMYMAKYEIFVAI